MISWAYPDGSPRRLMPLMSQYCKYGSILFKFGWDVVMKRANIRSYDRPNTSRSDCKDNDNMLSRQVDTPVYPFHSWVREIVELNGLKWPIWNGYLKLLITSPTNWLSWVNGCHCDDCADDGEWDSVTISNLYWCVFPHICYQYNLNIQSRNYKSLLRLP